MSHPLGLAGHSDADVLTHAVIDAVLGAVAAGDIGTHFPASDEQYRGASSLTLLRRVVEIAAEKGYGVHNVDAVVVCESPRLGPHTVLIRESLAGALAVPVDSVSVKASTTDGMGPAGRGEGIEAHAVVLMKRLG